MRSGSEPGVERCRPSMRTRTTDIFLSHLLVTEITRRILSCHSSCRTEAAHDLLVSRLRLPHRGLARRRRVHCGTSPGGSSEEPAVEPGFSLANAKSETKFRPRLYCRG